MIDIVRGLRRIAEEGYRFAGDAADEIERLRASLEEAEAECFEQARLNGMGSEREAALMAKLEMSERELERERMRLAACGVAALGYFNGCAKEYTSASLDDVLSLRAKIEAVEAQEPVAWFYTTNGGWDCYSPMKPPEDDYDAGSLMALYAIPSVKGDRK